MSWADTEQAELSSRVMTSITGDKCCRFESCVEDPGDRGGVVVSAEPNIGGVVF